MYSQLKAKLPAAPRSWLVTGAAGFIGSNIVETLLQHGQRVVGLDNLATGYMSNLDEVRESVGERAWSRFRFLHADIVDLAACRDAAVNIDHVLHNGALGSVPRSLEDPIATNAVNITGFVNVLVAARDAGVRSFVYAASSSTYGDEPSLPKVEHRIGAPLSPYAVTKLVNEIYADVFARCYGFTSIGLRYFNVFGPRQDPNGPYAGVIPKWIAAMIQDSSVAINGDGETSRDFCYVDNAVQANLLAALASPAAQNQVYNIAVGARTSLNDLFSKLQARLALQQIYYNRPPLRAPLRAGDVRHSLADISKATRLIGYEPAHTLDSGLALTIPWYFRQLKARFQVLQSGPNAG